ncbi:MAG: GNAT family N-acetyltransferase [Phycisphaerae bacterium]
MKPLLILPPAPNRWSALDDLFVGVAPELREDLEARFARGVPGASDAFAVSLNGGQILANATVSRRGEFGVLGYVYTRREQRGRGLALELIRTVIGWFDMIGGRRLYASTTRDAAERVFAPLGFKVLHDGDGGDGVRPENTARPERASSVAHDPTPASTPPDATAEMIMLARRASGAPEDPFAGLEGPVEIRPVTRADWPLMVALLQHRAGPDRRAPLAQSARTAEIDALKWIRDQERGVCTLHAAWQADRIIALATLATDKIGARTYAMILPSGGAPPELRAAVAAAARDRAYEHVEYPLEAL